MHARRYCRCAQTASNTPSEVAAELNVSAKRAWLRQVFHSTVEIRQRWELSRAQASQLRQAFGPSTEPGAPGFEPRLLSVGEILHVDTGVLVGSDA